MQRNFLFLQGCTCPFFSALGRRLRERGHGVARVNFNVGDMLMWWAGRSWNFRESAEEFGVFLNQLVERHGFTDIVMLGDTRPLHEVAISVASAYNLNSHVVEEGYFRPNWLTLERGGINGNSRLPRDPEWYRDIDGRVPVELPVESVSNSIRLLAAWELAYHLPNILNPLLFPGYRTHRPVISPVEFAGWGLRFSRMPYYEWRDRQLIDTLLTQKHHFFLFPLQLDSDSQITHHSPFSCIEDAIRLVMRSFAYHAHEQVRLVIKNHPLDTGLVDYGRIVRRIAAEYSFEDRCHYLESGRLDDLIPHAAGVVTINSTVGMAALEVDCPVFVLGRAVYAIKGLAADEDLDTFWRYPQFPDSNLYRSFKRVVLFTTQVNGGFYSLRGCQLAVNNALRFLEPECSPLEQFL